jgi:hypothetical protein
MISKSIHVFKLTFPFQAKKRQIYLEEAYSGTTKELDLLLENFSMEQPVKQAPEKGKKKIPASSEWI